MATTTANAVVRRYFNELGKHEAIKAAVEDLFLVLGRKSSERASELHAKLLGDLDSEMLVAGLSEALMTTRDWLTPGQIEELCLGASRADLAALAADGAWSWVVDYLRCHGVEGRVQRGAMKSTRIVEDAELTHVGRFESEFAPDIPAPTIPPEIATTLQSLGGSLRGGLARINTVEADQAGFLKREFAAAFGRARRLG